MAVCGIVTAYNLTMSNVLCVAAKNRGCKLHEVQAIMRHATTMEAHYNGALFAASWTAPQKVRKPDGTILLVAVDEKGKRVLSRYAYEKITAIKSVAPGYMNIDRAVKYVTERVASAGR